MIADWASLARDVRDVIGRDVVGMGRLLLGTGLGTALRLRSGVWEGCGSSAAAEGSADGNGPMVGA